MTYGTPGAILAAKAGAIKLCDGFINHHLALTVLTRGSIIKGSHVRTFRGTAGFTSQTI